MIDAISANLDQIRAMCRRHRVGSLFLIGSAATGEFDPRNSDIDLLVEFLPDAPRTGLSGSYFALRDELAALLGRSVDLVERAAVTNPLVAESMAASRVPLYAAA